MKTFLLLLILALTAYCASSDRPPLPDPYPEEAADAGTSSEFGDPPKQYATLPLLACQEDYVKGFKMCVYASEEGCVVLGTTPTAGEWQVRECIERGLKL